MACGGGKPPLLERMERFTNKVAIGTLVAAGVVGQLGVLLWGYTLVETFFFVVALAVAAISGALPITITVALAVATTRMARAAVSKVSFGLAPARSSSAIKALRSRLFSTPLSCSRWRVRAIFARAEIAKSLTVSPASAAASSISCFNSTGRRKLSRASWEYVVVTYEDCKNLGKRAVRQIATHAISRYREPVSHVPAAQSSSARSASVSMVKPLLWRISMAISKLSTIRATAGFPWGRMMSG
jgi:hypothetical protein